MQDTVRFGVIGAGKIGRLRVRSIVEEPAAQLAAVMDVSPAAAARAAHGTGATATSDIDRFFDTPMDAVVVSTPGPAHEDACLAAFSRGLHVLCEKPLANTVEGCQHILDAAIDAGCPRRIRPPLLPAFRFVKDTVAQVDPGATICVFGGDGLSNSFDWGTGSHVRDGAMMDVGIT
jgi:hypothetical protein